MDPIRIGIEDADGVITVTADRAVRVLLIRYDEFLAGPKPEACEVEVDRRKVEQLFRDPGSAAEEEP